jgi:hypothetical protein
MKEIMNIVKDKMDWKTKAKAMSDIRNNKELTFFQKTLMATYVESNPIKYKPTLNTLMSQFKVSKRTLNYAHEKLTELGYIEIIRKSANNNNNVDLHIHLIPIKSGAI